MLRLHMRILLLLKTDGCIPALTQCWARAGGEQRSGQTSAPLGWPVPAAQPAFTRTHSTLIFGEGRYASVTIRSNTDIGANNWNFKTLQLGPSALYENSANVEF